MVKSIKIISGLISFDNLKKVSKILGWYLTDEEIDEMIDDADKDFDNCVSNVLILKYCSFM